MRYTALVHLRSAPPSGVRAGRTWRRRARPFAHGRSQEEGLMKRSLAVTTLVVLVLSGLFWFADAWARVPSGGSSGSRGSRSYSAPVSPSTSSTSRSQPAAPPAASPLQTSPQRSGWGGMLGGMGGMLGGLLVGGLIGSMLFGGMGHGGFGGIGLIE